MQVAENLKHKLAHRMASFRKDPYSFVLYSFPWGTGELEKFDGPEDWQTDLLKQIRDGLITASQAIQEAIASGHGIGKSALVAWIILWSMATLPDTKGVVTANTERQLKTKPWAELAKWYRLFIAKHWFVFTATALYSAEAEHEKTWRFDMVPWSERNTEAFAGMHNKGRRVVVIFDEASAIPDQIWDVTEGALTDSDTEILWLVFGNPTRNSGRFHACFNRFRHRWKTQQIDSRSVRITNKEQIQKWIEDFGEDSDFVKVRVKGVFPSTSDHQFIPSNLVEAARKRHLQLQQYNFAPKVLTLDNAWTGGDAIVIGMRQGLYFTIKATFPKNDDDMYIAGQLARIEDEEKADAVFIDLGYGTGVYSAGKHMNRKWILIPNGSASPDPGFVNLRAYTWNEVKKWLAGGGAIPDRETLCTDLTGPEAYVVATGKNAGKIYLESKEDMKARGLASPNEGDSLALSFAMPVTPKSPAEKLGIAQKQEAYDPYKNLQQSVVSKPGVYDPYKNI